MQDYKIIIPNQEISRQVLNKAFQLGYANYLDSISHLNAGFLYLYKHNTIGFMPIGTDNYFRTHRNPEISYQEFLQLGEVKQQQINMEDLELKLSIAPKRAKNVTVGKSYSGILIDAEDTQVDTFEQAEYFRCVNDNGKEARYSIGLFEKPAVPVKHIPTCEEVIAGIQVTSGQVTSGEYLLFDDGYNYLDEGNVNCSCGIKSFNSIDGLYERISGFIEDSDFDFEHDKDELIEEIFKAIVSAKIDNSTCAFALFSTTNSNGALIDIMNTISDRREESSVTGFNRNPNSGNLICAWLIAK